VKTKVVSLCLLFFAQPAVAKLDATAIVRHGEDTMRGRSTQSLLTMIVKRPDYVRTLKLRSWTLGKGRALVEILDPAKEEGVSSLRVANNMWNYLPKVDQVVRVPTSMMLQSWMGSDFTNDDLMKSSSLVRDYRHKIIKRTKVGAEKSVLIKLIPKPNAPVVWGKILYWARLKDSLPIKQKYFDEDGQWIRTIHFSRFRKMDDRTIPTVVKITTSQGKNHTTVVSYQKILYDRRVSTQVFEKDKLRTISQKGKILSQGWTHTRMKKKSKAKPKRRKLARK